MFAPTESRTTFGCPRSLLLLFLLPFRLKCFQFFFLSLSLFFLFIVGLSRSILHLILVIVNPMFSRNSFRHGNMKLKVTSKKFFFPPKFFFYFENWINSIINFPKRRKKNLNSLSVICCFSAKRWLMLLVLGFNCHGLLEEQRGERRGGSAAAFTSNAFEGVNIRGQLTCWSRSR